MLKKIFNYALSRSDKGMPLYRIRPLIQAVDHFFYETPENTQAAPHIRDYVDLKRWMSLVIIALLPCIFMAIWNTGIQKLVYSSGDLELMDEFLAAARSFKAYKAFAFKDGRAWTILSLGLSAFLPVVLISYTVGGFWEVLFACVRRHDVAEGFLVTGMLYPLVLPPTIPYWMVAVGISAGVVLGKELFGGTGMNILNPALTSRAFLFFSFPSKMSGNVWVGTNPTVIRDSLAAINRDAAQAGVDGFTQATPLAHFNIPDEVKRVHIDTIAASFGRDVSSQPLIEQQLQQWNAGSSLTQLTPSETMDFMTAPFDAGGLGLSPDAYQNALDFYQLREGLAPLSDWNFLLGNRLGSFGETSVIACLIGAALLIATGVGSWRKMVATGLGALITAYLFQLLSQTIGPSEGLWNPARFSLPAYKHLLVGGLAFGMVFMVTDPVSSPSMKSAAWMYGLFVGAVTIIIRTINPAFSEGVMLAILLGNVFSPLFDHYAALHYRRRRHAVR